MEIVRVQNLTKTYATYERGSGFGETVKSFFHRKKVVVNAVDDVTFTIAQGEICGILGPNGAGKSTAIKMLCGALYPTSGDISVLGFNPAKERRRYVSQIGAVFGQKSQLIWDIPPADSFAMNKAIYGISNTDYKARLDELSVLLGTEEIMRKPTRVLSLGERMKCEFIMAMLHNPPIVFLDEPTIGLDVIAKNSIRTFIRSRNAAGTTFLLTTHDLDDVKELADRVVVINHGKKVFDDTLEKLRNSLGEKKIVELKLEQPHAFADTAEIKVLTQPSPLEVTLEIDTARLPVDAFLRTITAQVSFTDISVRELPMEEIITKIYMR
ncbi:MAG: ATP-binding cassette domain-containing protein [Oscillospiraceae bacterium]